VIDELRDGAILARVVQAGPVAAHKGIIFRSCDYRNETLSEKDQAIFEQTRAVPGVQYAISYIKDGQEMANYRRAFGSASRLIAKLERGQAMNTAQVIAQSADELWVCRGDLGAELGLAGMAEAVHTFSTLVPALPVPAIMAGQVLEHLTEHATPTRSEVCYLYDCLQQGYRGFVLSDETAIGRDPLGACRYMSIFK
jgi:pyruvate kinase